MDDKWQFMIIMSLLAMPHIAIISVFWLDVNEKSVI